MDCAQPTSPAFSPTNSAGSDPEIFTSITSELGASCDEIGFDCVRETSSRAAFMQAQGSVMTNKYAERLSGRPFTMGGCQFRRYRRETRH